jgi:hypothetical protein
MNRLDSSAAAINVSLNLSYLLYRAPILSVSDEYLLMCACNNILLWNIFLNSLNEPVIDDDGQ